MAKRKSEKINATDNTAAKKAKSKFRIAVAAATATGVLAAILAGVGIRNFIIQNEKEPEPPKPVTMIIPEEEALAIANGLNNIYSDIVEYQSGYGVKESSITYFDVQPESLTVIGSSVFNTKNYPTLTTAITFASEGWEEFYRTDYQTFVANYENNTASYEDAVAIINDCADFMETENVVSFTKLEILNDNNIQTVLKSVVEDYALGNNNISENVKQTMSTSLITNEITFKECGYAKRGFDADKKLYRYTFTAQFSFCGYSFNVSGTINNNAQIYSKAEFTAILLKEYQNNPEMFDVIATKDSLFATVFNQQQNKTSNNEIEMEN